MVNAAAGGGGGAGVVQIDIKALQSAITKIDSLVSTVSSQRSSIQSRVPIGLPSLADGSALALDMRWLEDQKTEPLQTVLDLAILLDDEHTGSVEFAGTGELDDIKATMGKELAKDLDGISEIHTLEDRERMTALAGILSRHASDPKVGGPFAAELGPDGVTRVLQELRGLTGPYSNYIDNTINNQSGNPDFDPNDERLRLEELQDSIASSLAKAVGTASCNGYLDDDFGEQLVNGDHSDAWSTGILFQYGAKNDVYFSEDLLVSSGDALIERESSAGWAQWQVNMHTPTLFGTDHGDDKLTDDPLLQWERSLKTNSDASQTVLLDEGRADYLLTRDTPYEDGTAIGDVLRSATIDRATSYGEAGKNAATISSHVVDYFGGDPSPLEGTKEEIGGIISTYIADVDRVAQSGQSEGAGTYTDGALLPDWLKDQGLPTYGITLDENDLYGVLGDIGDNDVASSAVGRGTMRLNEARIHAGIDVQLGPGDPIEDTILRAAGANAQLTGYMQDALLTGGIESEEADAEQRKKMAEFFLLPIDEIPTGGTGPLGGYILGEAKDRITDAYVGTGVQDSLSTSNEMFGEAKNGTTLQSLHAILESNSTRGPDDQLPVGNLADSTSGWPHENGHPVPVAQLDDDDIRRILNYSEGDLENNYAGAVKDHVDGGISDLIKGFDHK